MPCKWRCGGASDRLASSSTPIEAVNTARVPTDACYGTTACCAVLSKKGDCYDNAAMESWNHSLKWRPFTENAL